MPLAYPTCERQSDQIEQLAKRCGVGEETIRKALKGESSPRLQTMTMIAVGPGVSIVDLLTPGFAARKKASVETDRPLMRARA